MALETLSRNGKGGKGRRKKGQSEFSFQTDIYSGPFFPIERIRGVATPSYLGGGSDPAFGRYVEKHWTPNIDVRKMTENYYNEMVKQRRGN